MTYASFNPFAILVSTVIAFALGALWYGFLFKDAWIRLNGYAGLSEAETAQMQADAPKAYAVSFVCYAVMASGLTVLADYMILTSLTQALKLGLLAFGGFVAPIGLIANFYSDRPIGAWLLDGVYQFLYILLMSVVVVLWM